MRLHFIFALIAINLVLLSFAALLYVIGKILAL